MLDFSACEFIELSHRFGILLGQYKKNPDPNILGNSLNVLLEKSKVLGLRVTNSQILMWITEIVNVHPDSVDIQKLRTEGQIQIVNASIDQDRAIHHIETLYSTMLAEMRSILFRAIPADRSVYCDPHWLADGPISSRFPTSIRELQRAGSCYALGEATASVSHSMRALEPGLSALAVHFSIPHDQGNWQTLIERIEADIRKIGNQPKSQQKMDEEKFFGAAASHLYFIKNAWRNHVAHTRDSYSDNEALQVLQSTQRFIESLCARLQEA